MRDMTEAERKDIYEKNRCPACHGTRFWEGPAGGMCQNMECVTCGLGINIDPIGLVAQIIQNPDTSRGVKLYLPGEDDDEEPEVITDRPWWRRVLP